MSRQDTAYRCDRCGALATAKRCPPGWRLRGADHICQRCWPHEPAESAAVWRYGLTGPVTLPEAFWWQQRAARALWDALCAASDDALQQAQALRARYAPEAVATADALRAEAAAAWSAAEEARTAWRTALPDTQDQAHDRYQAARRAAVAAGQRVGAAYADAKRAAQRAGCDERPIWAELARLQREAPTWTWREARDEYDRPRVVRDPAGWRLVRSLADQVIEEYQTAWSAWISHRREGRGMPQPHGHGLRDRVRAVLRYSNGQSAARLATGTPSLTLRPLATDAAGRALAELTMRVGGDAYACGQVVLHRPLPVGEDAIRRVELCGRRARWDRWVWSLHVTIREPLVLLSGHADRAAATAVDLRWRADGESLQVAHWLAADGREGAVTIDTAQRRSRVARGGLPSSWIESGAWQVRSDALFEAVKLAVWAAHEGEAPYSEPYRRLRSSGLLRAWRAGDYPMAATVLAEWARWHTTTQRTLARCRDRLEARRDQLYYEAAHALCRMSARLVIEGSGGGAMDLRPLASGDDPVAGGQRHIVAPARWRTILLRVAQRYGVPVTVIDAAYTSRTCPSCGAVAQQGRHLQLTCPQGHRFDQRRAACVELLRRWREGSGGGGLAGGGRRRGHTRRPKARAAALAERTDSASVA